MGNAEERIRQAEYQRVTACTKQPNFIGFLDSRSGRRTR
jgi:hypothetical protein